jgi:hypothetical protein
MGTKKKATKATTKARAKKAQARRGIAWPLRLWHGTSTKALEKLRAARSTRGLYLTSDENTACDYAESSARRDRSEPVLVEIDVQALRAAGGDVAYDEDNGETIFEQILYRGPLPGKLIRKVEKI